MNYLSYRISLYKLDRKRAKEEAVFRKKLVGASRTGKYEEVLLRERLPLELCDEEIYILMTQRLTAIADKLLIQLPPKPVPEEGDVITEDETWIRSNCYGQWYLTNKGIVDVRKLIRQEKKERREAVAFWFALIFGLIGAIISLFTVIKK